MNQNTFQLRCKQENLNINHYLDFCVQTIRVERIIGSVTRWREFDHRFLPENADKEKYFRILDANNQGIPLPAIAVYRINEDYYVIDGNHRVVVAKKTNQVFIDAEVKDLIPPYDTLAHRLWYTRQRFEYKNKIVLHFTKIKSYKRMKKYILRWRLQSKKDNEADRSPEKLMEAWCEEVYHPLCKYLNTQKIQKSFPKRSLDDICLRVAQRQINQSFQQKHLVDIDEVAEDFCLESNSQIKKRKRGINGSTVANKRYQRRRRGKPMS